MKSQINEIKKMQRIAGLITESEYQESLNISEYKKTDIDAIKELIELLKQVQEKNKSLKAVPVNTLNKLIEYMENLIISAKYMGDNDNRSNYDLH